jgi:membrane-associated phospholipid phosphatase
MLSRLRPPGVPAAGAEPAVAWRWPLLAAAVSSVGLALTWLVAELVPGGQAHDAVALAGFSALSRPRVDALAHGVVRLVDAGPYAIAGVVLSVIALVRGRPRLALAVPLVLFCAALTAEALKPLLAHAHATGLYGAPHVADASWPSGHSTAAMALALCAVLVAPARWRVAAATLGSAFAVAVSFALLTLAWHLPSDVVGGYLVAGLWVSLAVAALRAVEARWPARSGRRAVTRAGHALRVGPGLSGAEALVPMLVLGCGAALVAGAAILRPHQVFDFADAHRSLLVAALAIIALAAAMATGLAAVLRR